MLRRPPKPMSGLPTGTSDNDLSVMVLAPVTIAIRYFPFRVWVPSLRPREQRLPFPDRHLVGIRGPTPIALEGHFPRMLRIYP